jgi:DNA-binding LytR/AlgR family response regulator
MIYIVIAIPVIILILLFVSNITIREYSKINTNDSTNDNYAEISQQKTKAEIKTFPIKINDKTIFINIENVTSFTADNNYVNLNDIEGNKYLLDNSLKNLMDKLPANFIRIHRSTIVNKKLIKEIYKYFNGRYAIIMNDKLKSKLISSQSYSKTIKEIIEL